MKVIDGADVPLGRVASHVAKLAMKGEEIAVVNCKEIIMTGNKKDILGKFSERKTKVGSGQKGPKYSLTTEKVVKRAIRGMLPRVRAGGRGKDAFQKIKCYLGVPSEFEDSEKEKIEIKAKRKANKMGDLLKK